MPFFDTHTHLDYLHHDTGEPLAQLMDNAKQVDVQKILIVAVKEPDFKTIQNEANNRLSNKRGTIAMARTSDPHSATAQFFINVADNDFLNYRSKEMFGREVVQEWGYAVFGEVVEGMDVVDKIKKVKTGNKGFHQDVPTEDVVITSVSVE